MIFGRKLAAAPLAAVAMLCAFLVGCNGNGEKEVREVVRPVVTMTVGTPGAGRVRTFSGVARAGIETMLSFRVSGEIEKLPVKVGSRVKKGDAIAVLDPTDYELQAKQAEAELAKAGAAFNQADSDYERARLLYEAANISKSELDNAQAAYKSARAQVEVARKRLELARTQLGYTVLRAPVDGAIAEVPVEVHQTVQSGQAVAMLTGGESVEFQIGVPETLIYSIRHGDTASITFESLPDSVFEAEVVEVGVESRELTTFPVKLRIKDPDARILPGMIGEAAFEFAGEGGIILPPQAVASRADGSRYVWVVDRAGMTVQSRDVTVGEITTQGLTVLSGVRPGDVIVIRGVHRLTEGRKVKLLDSAR